MGPKKQDFWPKFNKLKGNQCILRIRGAPVRQKLGMILENEEVQKLPLEKNIFYKKWSPLLIFLNEFVFEKFRRSWLWKYNFGTFWWIHRRIVLKKIPLSILILGQKSCILGPTISKIPQPNCMYNGHFTNQISCLEMLTSTYTAVLPALLCNWMLKKTGGNIFWDYQHF